MSTVPITRANRARMTTLTTGTGTVTLGTAVDNSWLTFAEAGVADGKTVRYLIEEGDDFEIGEGVYASSGTTLTRATIYKSKIGGTAGTSAMNLAGAAIVSIVGIAEDWNEIREKLTAARTYYVRTDGSDSNDGLSNTAGGAFLTLQACYNHIRSKLDLAGYVVTIQVVDGTYTAGVSLTGPLVGGLGAYLVLKGNATTPSNVVISTTSASCVLAGKGAYIKVQDLKMQTTTAGDCLGAYEYSVIEFTNVEFGACATHHCEAWRYGQVNGIGSYTISGGAISHMHAYSMAYISIVSLTVTLTGTPAFSSWFTGNSQSNIACAAVTFTGAATGTRYLVHKNGVTDTSGGGASFFPGNASGSTATGGVYA